MLDLYDSYSSRDIYIYTNTAILKNMNYFVRSHTGGVGADYSDFTDFP